MENITLGNIGVGVAFLVALISGIAYLIKQLKHMITNLFKEQLNEIDKRFSEQEQMIKNVDLESCKNFLVRFLADVEKGNEIDEIERERFWEQYQHYERSGGNSYIHQKVERLKAENKL